MIVFSSTVLPQPLSPITANVWPRGIVKSMSRSTCCRAKIDAHPLQLDQRALRIGDVGCGGDHRYLPSPLGEGRG